MHADSGPQATPLRASRTTAVLAAAAIASAILLGVVLRLVDPLSSPVVPAEDPYTHMALVREHLRTGELDALNDNADLYPPGLHAFLASAWVYTGSDLYGIIRIGPVILGAVGILGMGVLLWRQAGPVAGFVAALALAVAPEAIFRTTMMSPTALDLAILPFFLYALLHVLAGRLAWLGVAAPMALFLAFAHPWLLAILCVAGVAFLLCAVLFPWASSRAEPLTLHGIVSCIAVLGSSLGIAFLMPGFGGVLGLPRSTDLTPLGLGIAAAALAPAVAVAMLRRRSGRPNRWLQRGPPPLRLRLGLSAAIAATLLGVGFLAARGGMPAFVDLPRMVGWPILALAFAALVALPFIASPVANLAAALLAATLPFVVFNPLDSEFLSHRTAVFLIVALAALAGVLAGALVRSVTQALQAWASRPARAARPAPPRRVARKFPAAVVPALLVSILLGGSIYAGTPDGYPGGWYRLFSPCELDGLRDVAGQADADPAAILITGDWQSKLVLAALTNDASRVWFMSDFFTSEQVRGDLVAVMQHQGRPLVVVTDRYLAIETPGADAGFVSSPPWRQVGSYCTGLGFEQPRIAAFATDGGSP